MDLLCLLLVTGFTFVLFSGSLCAESVNFCLSVGSTFLQLSEFLDLSFFLFGEAFCGHEFGLFGGRFVPLVIQYVCLQDALILLFLLLQRKSMLIRHIHLTEHLGDLFPLHSSLAVLFHFLPLNIGQQLQLLLLSHLNLLQPYFLVPLNLVCDDSSPPISRLFSAMGALLLLLQILQAFDFHHQVELSLLFDPLFFKPLRLD